MTWLDVLDDERGVRAIYGDEPPSLQRVTLHEVCLHRDGPRVTLRLDLPEYPSSPPKKWSTQGFNVVQIKLMFVAVVAFSIDGWSNESLVDMTLEKRDDNVRAATSAGLADLSVEAESALVSSISAYRSE